jgi:GntR family transcriptional repressor for pyruvate dehydrogenase complex
MEEAFVHMKSAAALPKDNTDRMERWVAADLAFHTALAQASQNPLLRMLLDPMSAHLLEFRRMASSAPGAMEDALNYHRELLEHVRAHDVSACRNTMREHLERAAEWVRVIGLTS